MKKQEKLGIR